MSFETLYNTIRTRFKDNVATPQSLTTYYDNQAAPPINGTVWARVTIVGGSSQQTSLGASKDYRHAGVLFIQLYDALEKGDKALLALADIIVPHFRVVTVGSVRFYTPSVVPVGRSTTTPFSELSQSNPAQWWQVNVQCPFNDVEVVSS